MTTVSPMTLRRGDLHLLDSDLAQRLLASTELAQYRYAGPEQAAVSIAQVDQPGTGMARIAVRPTWLGVLDFMTRSPGGGTAEQFARRGR